MTRCFAMAPLDSWCFSSYACSRSLSREGGFATTAHPRPRAPDGTFSAPQPYDLAAPYVRLPGLPHSYRRIPYPWAPDTLLPQMRMLTAEGYRRQLWDSNIDQRVMADNVLDLLGTLMWPRAVHDRALAGGVLHTRTMEGREAFQFPLGRDAHHPQCMLMDPARVIAAEYVTRGRGYVWLMLGQIGHGRARVNIKEGAHRFVLWANWGPPPPDIADPVAMHMCHDKACLNPFHLVWGEIWENASPDADIHAQERWDQQRGGL
jgi:hypothetical protein